MNNLTPEQEATLKEKLHNLLSKMQHVIVQGQGLALTPNEMRLLIWAMPKQREAEPTPTPTPLPDKDKPVIPEYVFTTWKQPAERRMKTHEHNFVCYMCNKQVTVYNTRKTPPPCCPNCKLNHDRKLTNERKKKHVAKQKTTKQ